MLRVLSSFFLLTTTIWLTIVALWYVLDYIFYIFSFFPTTTTYESFYYIIMLGLLCSIIVNYYIICYFQKKKYIKLNKKINMGIVYDFYFFCNILVKNLNFFYYFICLPKIFFSKLYLPEFLFFFNFFLNKFLIFFWKPLITKLSYLGRFFKESKKYYKIFKK